MITLTGEIEIGEMDRISKLPEPIVHRILGFLKTYKDLVRMSVLSKTWFHQTASFPVLHFHEDLFTSQESFYKYDEYINRESFFKYVEYTTTRFYHQNVTAHTFELVTTLKPAEVDIVNRCLGLVIQNGVLKLVIDIQKLLVVDIEKPSHVSAMPMYRLPNILLSASMLKLLRISGCELPSSLMVDAVHFESLNYLCLYGVPLSDEVITYLIASCPLLQGFGVEKCYGFKSFCVYGHQNLKRIDMHFDTPLKRIHVEAPNLLLLVLQDESNRGAQAMNFASCEKLTKVSYIGLSPLNSNGLTRFLPNFPFVEVLVLATRYKGNNLKLSSHSLRKLMLYSHYDLEDVEFNFPNLETFIYADRDRFQSSPEFKMLRDLIWDGPVVLTHVNSSMICYPRDNIDALWFQKLRLFLDKKNGFKVSKFFIHPILSQKFKQLKKLKAMKFPPYELEHFELKVDTHDDFFALTDFVDAVLWCFRPRSITLGSFFDSTKHEKKIKKDVVKFTNKKLLEQEDEGHTKVRIVSPSSSEAQKDCMGMKSLLTALPCEGETISFIKEEGF